MREYNIPQPQRVRRIEKSFAWIDHRLLRNGYLRFEIFNAGGVQAVPRFDQGIALQPDRWYHVAGSYDGATLRVFVNGYLSASNACGAQTIAATAQPLRIGANSAGTFYGFAGIIDEVRISATARYSANFALPPAPFVADPDTRLLLHFGEGSGQYVVDAAGALPSGTLGSTTDVQAVDPTWTTSACIGDRSTALSCTDLFGFAPSYYWCAESPTDCEFYIYGGGANNCSEVCGERGVACIESYGNSGYCGRNPAIGCDTYYTDQICLCAR